METNKNTVNAAALPVENLATYNFSDEHVYAMLLAGGKGTRLYIAGSIPKQFAPKFEGVTFVQDITRMISKAIKPSRIIVVVTNPEQKEFAIKQLAPLGVPSTNVVEFDPHYGYVAVMAMACDWIANIDPDATVLISPTDQHITEEDAFAEDIKNALHYAQKENVLLGVRVADANIVGGCGNAIYDTAQPGPVYDISYFIEKPGNAFDKNGNQRYDEVTHEKLGPEYVAKLLRRDGSKVNTGIYALRVSEMQKAFPAAEIEKLLKKYYDEGSEKTDLGIDTGLMAEKLNMKLIHGKFGWADCGTLAAYYGIQRKTPNHYNASIGEISRFECRDSLFVSNTKGIHIYATGIKDGLAVVACATKTGGINVAVMNMAESQEAGKVTEFFERGERASYSYCSENCVIMPSNISKSCRFAFLGVQNIYVFVNRLDDGDINVNVSASGKCTYEHTAKEEDSSEN